jgi:Plasmid pRiA4b ORF-3-like protein
MAATVQRLPAAAPRVLQLRITLTDLTPAIWRRVRVPDTITLTRLHRVIQAVMGWTDSHLHEFRIGGERYGTPDPDWDAAGSVQPEQRVRLAQCLGRTKTFRYTYDFGDCWEHRLTVEKVLPIQDVPHSPVCVAGANACPPEDVGGPPGYELFLDAIADPEHPEHAAMLAWCGHSFDPRAFDLAQANARLQHIKL